MKQTGSQQKHQKWMIYGLPPFFLFLLFVCSCGSGAQTDSTASGDGARVAFSVRWERASDTAIGSVLPFDLTDCQDIDTVSAGIYDTGSRLLQSGGPWDCSNGSGVVTDVPAGNRATAVVFGNDTQGRPIFRGESSDFFDLIAGETVNAGTIVAGSFIPVLTAPSDGATVLAADLSVSLEWQEMADAEGYRIQIAASGDFADTVVDDDTVTASFITEPGALQDGVTYYWRVFGFGFDGVESAPSDTRTFTPAAQGVMVSITSPENGTTLDADANLSFSASVTDEWGTAVTAFNSVVWESSRDGAIGETLNFSGALTSPGLHTITLTVEDERGFSNSDQITVSIGRLIPSITSPQDGGSSVSGLGLDFTGAVQYEGISPGTVTSIRWRSDLEGLIGNTLSFSGDLTVPGTHTITLSVVDDLGLEGSAAVQFSITNTRPVITFSVPSEGTAFAETSANYDGIAFSANATDAEDGEFIPASQFTWTLYDDAGLTTAVGSWTNWKTATIGGIYGGLPYDWAIGDYWMVLTVEDSYKAEAIEVRSFSVN